MVIIHTVLLVTLLIVVLVTLHSVSDTNRLQEKLEGRMKAIEAKNYDIYYKTDVTRDNLRYLITCILRIHRRLDTLTSRVHPIPTWKLTGVTVTGMRETLASGICKEEICISPQRPCSDLKLEVDAPWLITGFRVGQCAIGITNQQSSREVVWSGSASVGLDIRISLSQGEAC